MTGCIQTQRPSKGDFVVGHRAAAFFADPGLPAVRGIIVDVSPTGHIVSFEIPAFLAALGLPKLSRWSWRPSVAAYQQHGYRTRKNEGLALIREKVSP